jgi:hypothetical protein
VARADALEHPAGRACRRGGVEAPRHGDEDDAGEGGASAGQEARRLVAGQDLKRTQGYMIQLEGTYGIQKEQAQYFPAQGSFLDALCGDPVGTIHKSSSLLPGERCAN